MLAGQLRHLLAVMSLPSIGLGIIPHADRSGWWPVESFYVFDDAQANVELVSGFLTINQPREIAMYAASFARLAELAVAGEQARALIEAALAELEADPR
ncbi:MAG: transcriptional regulator, family [Actinomycetia bacterium]|nr:transcriptional regulator, family [Actinomycetes bacterium]